MDEIGLECGIEAVDIMGDEVGAFHHFVYRLRLNVSVLANLAEYES